MIGYIYIIYNETNNKVYVGKTERTIEERYKEHLQEAKLKTGTFNILYENMRNIGIENFKISCLEVYEYDGDDKELFKIQLKLKEDRWINRLNPKLNTERRTENIDIDYIENINKELKKIEFEPLELVKWYNLDKKYDIHITLYCNETVYIKDKSSNIISKYKKRDIIYDEDHQYIITDIFGKYLHSYRIDIETKQVLNKTERLQLRYKDLIYNYSKFVK